MVTDHRWTGGRESGSGGRSIQLLSLCANFIRGEGVRGALNGVSDLPHRGSLSLTLPRRGNKDVMWRVGGLLHLPLFKSLMLMIKVPRFSFFVPLFPLSLTPSVALYFWRQWVILVIHCFLCDSCSPIQCVYVWLWVSHSEPPPTRSSSSTPVQIFIRFVCLWWCWPPTNTLMLLHRFNMFYYLFCRSYGHTMRRGQLCGGWVVALNSMEADRVDISP